MYGSAIIVQSSARPSWVTTHLRGQYGNFILKARPGEFPLLPVDLTQAVGVRGISKGARELPCVYL